MLASSKGNLVFEDRDTEKVSEEEKISIGVLRKVNSTESWQMPLPFFNGGNIWILKATGFNRGRGIHVFSSADELKTLIKEY